MTDILLLPDAFRGRPGTASPSLVLQPGSGTPPFPTWGWSWADSASSYLYAVVPTSAYSSGNFTLRTFWRSVSSGATSGTIEIGAALAAYTPNTDSGDLLADSLATEVTGTDTHLGTTATRLHQFDITINQLDSIAAADFAMLRIGRIIGGSDTLVGNIVTQQFVLSHS